MQDRHHPKNNHRSERKITSPELIDLTNILDQLAEKTTSESPTISKNEEMLQIDNAILEIEKILSKNFKNLSLKAIDELLYLLVKANFKKNTLDEYPHIATQLVDKIELLLQNLREQKDPTFNEKHIEILWSFKKLNYNAENFRYLNNIIFPLLNRKKDFCLSYLHLCSELGFTAYHMRKTAYKPIPAIIAFLQNPKGDEDPSLASRKLLRSISLLGFSKKDFTSKERDILLEKIPAILDNVKNKGEKPDYLIKFFWMLARLDFDFAELKDKPIMKKVSEYYKAYPKTFIEIENIALFLWSMAAINVPTDYSLYKKFIEKVLPTLQYAPLETEDYISQILTGRLYFDLNLSPTRRELLGKKLHRKHKSSELHLLLENIIRRLLDEEREKDPTIPEPPKPMHEYTFEHGIIVVDTALSEDFVIEFDGALHSNQNVSDKLKNRLLEKLGVTCIRVSSEEIYNAKAKDDLLHFLKVKIIQPYLHHHQEKLQKMEKEEKQYDVADNFYNQTPIAWSEPVENDGFYDQPPIEWEQSQPKLTFSEIVRKAEIAAKIAEKKTSLEKETPKKIPTAITLPKKVILPEIKVLSKPTPPASIENTTNDVVSFPIGNTKETPKSFFQPIQKKKRRITTKVAIPHSEEKISRSAALNHVDEHLEKLLFGRQAENLFEIKLEIASALNKHSVLEGELEKALGNNLIITTSTQGCWFFKKTIHTLHFYEKDFEKNLQGFSRHASLR